MDFESWRPWRRQSLQFGSVRQFRVFCSKDGMLHPCADRLGRATFKLQALFQGPLAKLMAQDLFSESLLYKL